MSESKFIKDQYTVFQEGHPQSEGWKVYECHDSLANRLNLELVLDFIRDRHPGIVRRRFASNQVRTADMIGRSEDSHPVVLGQDWDTEHELDANGWEAWSR